jgi:hypothetical protein
MASDEAGAMVGCTSPQSLSSTYWRASMTRRARATAGRFGVQVAIARGWDAGARDHRSIELDP